MLVMVVFFIAFRWIHLSTPLIRLFLLVLILLLMPTLNFLPVWFALSLLRFRLPSRLPMMFILDRKRGSAGMPRPISYAVFCLKKKEEALPATLVRGQFEKVVSVQETFLLGHLVIRFAHVCI